MIYIYLYVQGGERFSSSPQKLSPDTSRIKRVVETIMGGGAAVGSRDPLAAPSPPGAAARRLLVSQFVYGGDGKAAR